MGSSSRGGRTVISQVTIIQNRHWDGNGTNWLFSVTAWIVGVKHSSQGGPAVQRGQGRADGTNAEKNQTNRYEHIQAVAEDPRNRVKGDALVGRTTLDSQPNAPK
jgi:hypothetical protein